MAPLLPGIRITLPRGAFGLIKMTREPPISTVSSASAGAPARPTRIAASPKHSIKRRFFITLFPAQKALALWFLARTLIPRGFDHETAVTASQRRVASYAQRLKVDPSDQFHGRIGDQPQFDLADQ